MSGIGPGDVVVCVDASRREGDGDAPAGGFIKLGRTYRITRATVIRGVPGVQLEGDPNNMVPGFANYFWHADRFRKIDRADESFCRQVRKCRPLRTKEPANA